MASVYDIYNELVLTESQAEFVCVSEQVGTKRIKNDSVLFLNKLFQIEPDII